MFCSDSALAVVSLMLPSIGWLVQSVLAEFRVTTSRMSSIWQVLGAYFILNGRFLRSIV
jgi:hypothetical protein